MASIALLKTAFYIEACLFVFLGDNQEAVWQHSSPGTKVPISAQILVACVTLGSHLPSEGLCFRMCKMDTVTPASQDSCEAARDHSCEWGLCGVVGAVVAHGGSVCQSPLSFLPAPS